MSAHLLMMTPLQPATLRVTSQAQNKALISGTLLARLRTFNPHSLHDTQWSYLCTRLNNSCHGKRNIFLLLCWSEKKNPKKTNLWALCGGASEGALKRPTFSPRIPKQLMLAAPLVAGHQAHH